MLAALVTLRRHRQEKDDTTSRTVKKRTTAKRTTNSKTKANINPECQSRYCSGDCTAAKD